MAHNADTTLGHSADTTPGHNADRTLVHNAFTGTWQQCTRPTCLTARPFRIGTTEKLNGRIMTRKLLSGVRSGPVKLWSSAFVKLDSVAVTLVVNPATTMPIRSRSGCKGLIEKLRAERGQKLGSWFKQFY